MKFFLQKGSLLVEINEACHAEPGADILEFKDISQAEGFLRQFWGDANNRNAIRSLVHGRSIYGRPDMMGDHEVIRDAARLIHSGRVGVVERLTRGFGGGASVQPGKGKGKGKGEQPGGETPVTPPPEKKKAGPVVEIDAPKLVLVKKDHQDKAHRLKVRLGTTAAFDGKGKLTFPDEVAVFKTQSGGTALASPMGDIPGKDLTSGYNVYVEARKPSAGVEKTVLTLELTQTGQVEVTSPGKAEDKLTCVELKLGICKTRPEGGGDPPRLSEAEKIDPGRPVVVQGASDDRLFSERARLILEKAKPTDFAGKMVLKPLKANLEIFAEAEEKPAAGQSALAGDGLKIDNGDVDEANGKTFWVQGKTKSAAMKDTGVKVELEDLPGQEGDKVVATVLKAELKVFKSRAQLPASGDPAAISDGDKTTKGRYLHIQDGGFHHGRAMLNVAKVEPDGFTGKLVLTAWEVDPGAGTESKLSASHRLKLFTDEVAASGQAAQAFDLTIDHDGSFPAGGKKFWVEGARISGKLRDAQIRLGVKDYDKGADRAAFTVVRFKNLKADIPSTPANINRLGNSPVNRCDLVVGGGALSANDFDESYATNKPLPLVENCIRNADRINLSVEIEPAAAKDDVSWSIRRHKGGTGDHADIIALKGNDDVTIAQDGGDKLKAAMLADNVGSFRLRPFIDCNGSGKYDDADDGGTRIDREPFILMNLVLIRVKGFNNLSVANSAAGSPGIVKDGLGRPQSVNGGDFAGTGNDAVHMKATARVIGGGQDGKRGLDMLFTGWVNNERNCPTSPGPNGWGEDVTHSFQKGPPPPNPVKRTRCFWRGGGVEITGPMLDSGYAGQGTGGDSCTGTAGANGGTVTKTDDPSGIGQRWEAENPDSPGGGILLAHPTDAAARLRNFKFNIDFRCDMVFWTNRDGVSGPSNAPASRLYSSVQTNTWNMRLESNFGAGFAETVVTAKTVTFNKDPDPTRLATPVDSSGLETRLPDGLNSLQADVPF